ncbi:MAG: hypothetical protein OXG35_13295, partial [Acidobacteria bacterium]|nr:hypothetical protein [Acidobacteriota bacterium]
SDAPKPAPEAAESLAPAPEPPSPKEVVDAVADRLEELSGTRVTPTQITTHREDVTEEKLKRLRRGMLPPYDKLSTLLAAIETALVIKPAGGPLPGALEHARFTNETMIPVVQITPHDSGTTVSSEPITKLPAPWDLADEDACYMICPDDRMNPSGMNAGEYCLVGRGGTSAEPHLPVCLELTNGTRMLGLMDNVPDRGGKPITFMQWGTPENDYKLTLREIPNGDIARELRVLAIYDGRPSVHRTPGRRMIDLN